MGQVQAREESQEKVDESILRDARVDAQGALLLSEKHLSANALRYVSGSELEKQLNIVQTLALDGNGLLEIPNDIISMLDPCVLRALWLDGNRLTCLPALGGLTALERLHVADNQLVALPPEMALLTALKVLNVSRNRLLALPDELCGCTALERVWFSGNSLDRVPHVFRSLVGLRMVWLDANCLQCLSPCVGAWEGLEELQLSGNSDLQQLPDELGYCTSLAKLMLKGCEALQVPPMEVRAQGTSAILAFLRRRAEQGTEKCWCARWMFVGFERVGKTSLSRAVRGEPFNPSEESTDGLGLADLRLEAAAVRQWLGLDETQTLVEGVDMDLPEQRDGQSLDVSMWDMAGQNLYYLTHDFFLSPRALYVLLWRCDKTPPPEARSGTDDHARSWTCREDSQRLCVDMVQVEHWLACLDARAPGANVLIVGTHAQTQVGGTDLTLPEEAAVRLPPGAMELQSRHKSLSLRFHFVDSATNFGVGEVRKSLMLMTLRSSRADCNLPITVPTAWLHLRTRCMEEVSRLKLITPARPPVQSWDNFIATCGKSCPRVQEAVGLWHGLGDLWHYGAGCVDDVPSEKDFIVLQSQWLADLLRCVVTQTGATDWIRESGGLASETWLQQCFAACSVDLCRAVFLLDKLELAIPQCHLDDKGGVQYLFPAMLPQKSSLPLWRSFSTGQGVKSRGVYLRLPEHFQPAGLFPRLLLRCLKSLNMKQGSEGMWLYDAHLLSADGVLGLHLCQAIHEGAAELVAVVNIVVDGGQAAPLLRARDDLLRAVLAEAASLFSESFPGLLPPSSTGDSLARRAASLFRVPCLHCYSANGFLLTDVEESFRQQQDEVRCPKCDRTSSVLQVLGQAHAFSPTSFRPLVESSVISSGLDGLLRHRQRGF